MNKEKDTDSKAGYVPTFHRAYLHPRHWGTWFGAGVLCALAYMPRQNLHLISASPSADE